MSLDKLHIKDLRLILSYGDWSTCLLETGQSEMVVAFQIGPKEEANLDIPLAGYMSFFRHISDIDVQLGR